MPKLLGPNWNCPISKKKCTLLAAALLAWAPVSSGLRGQVDLAAVRTRADQGDPEALNALGNAFANGAGVPQNHAEALRLYQVAAGRGLAAAHFNLGMMYELGRGVPADAATAFRHYLKAAEQGFAPAQFNVGNMYANGTGVQQDYFEAALWFRQAADRNVPEAQYNLALGYEIGRGVAKDEAAAQRWYRAAAAQGYARAQYNLALMLEEGRGSSADPAAAVELYRAAALQNFAPAQNNLGILLAEGRGAPADLVEAYAWLAVAVENGTKPTGRDIVGQQLSPSQLAQANATIGRMRAQLGGRGPAASTSVAGAAPAANPSASMPRVAAADREAERLRAENAPLAAPPATRPAAAGAAVPLADTSSIALPQLAAADSRIAKLLTDNTRLNEEVKRSTIELTNLMRQLRIAQEKLGRKETAGGTEAGQVAELKRQLEELRARQQRLSEENRRLQAAATNTPAASPPEMARLRAEIAAARAAQTEAERKMAASEAAAGKERERLTAQLAEVQRRTAQSPPPGPDAAALRAERDTLQREKNALEQELRQVQADSVATRALMDKVEQANGVLGARVDALLSERDRLAATPDATAAAQSQVVEAEKARDALAAEKAALAGRVAELTTRLVENEQVSARLEQANRALGGQIDALTAERDRLATAARAPGNDRETVDKLGAQLESAGRSIAELKARNESLEKDLQVAKQSAAAALAAQAAAAQAAPSEAMKLEMQTLQNHVRTLEMRVEEERTNMSRELAALATQLQSSRESNRALAEANRALLQARGSEDAMVKDEVEQLSARMKQVQEELEKTRAESAALQTQLAESSRAAEQHGASVAELTGLNEQLKSENATLERQAAQWQQTLEQAQAEIAELKHRASSSEKVARDQVAAMSELTTANENLQGQVNELGGQLQTVRAENARLLAAGESAETFRSEVAELRTRLTDAQRIAEQHSATVAELTGANAKLAGELQDLQAQLAALRSENAQLAQSDEARQAAEQRAASLMAAAAQLGAAQRDLAAARSEIARLNETVQSLDRDRTTRVAQLQQENAAISARLRQAQGTLDQIASAARLINTGSGAPMPMVPGTAAPTRVPAGTPTISVTRPAAPAPAPPRIHVVAEGDTLTRISARYYGTGGRWQEIYEANRDVLRGENALRPGQRLRIP